MQNLSNQHLKKLLSRTTRPNRKIQVLCISVNTQLFLAWIVRGEGRLTEHFHTLICRVCRDHASYYATGGAPTQLHWTPCRLEPTKQIITFNSMMRNWESKWVYPLTQLVIVFFQFFWFSATSKFDSLNFSSALLR